MVWNLLLQDGSEGPSLIDYSVTQKSRLSPTLLLMAHSKNQLQSKLQLPVGARRVADSARGWRADCRVGVAELRAIENVVTLRAKL